MDGKEKCVEKSCRHCMVDIGAFSKHYRSKGHTNRECCRVNAGLDPKGNGEARCCACSGTGVIIVTINMDEY